MDSSINQSLKENTTKNRHCPNFRIAGRARHSVRAVLHICGGQRTARPTEIRTPPKNSRESVQSSAPRPVAAAKLPALATILGIVPANLKTSAAVLETVAAQFGTSLRDSGSSSRKVEKSSRDFENRCRQVGTCSREIGRSSHEVGSRSAKLGVVPAKLETPPAKLESLAASQKRLKHQKNDQNRCFQVGTSSGQQLPMVKKRQLQLSQSRVNPGLEGLQARKIIARGKVLAAP